MKQTETNLFFTDFQTNASKFCLCQINRYDYLLKHHKRTEKSKYMIDPGVHELKIRYDYSRINQLNEMAQSNKEFISIDYPSDMNEEMSDIFIRRTNLNNQKYANKSKYIIGIQSIREDFQSFVKNFNYNLPLMNRHIVGIGNLCRIMRPNQYTDNLFKFLNENIMGNRYHFFGLSLRLIKKYLQSPNFYWSVDSTKFTKTVNDSLKYQYGLNCKKENRDIFFLEYIKSIRNSGIEIYYE
jgi:hypothetical protein